SLCASAAQKARTGRGAHSHRSRPGVLSGALLRSRRPGSMNRQQTPAASRGTPARSQRSLFGPILYWMLGPLLLLLWPVSITITYLGAQDSADLPYDRALATTITLLSQQVRNVDDTPRLTLSSATQAILQGDETDSMFYRVQAAD